MGSGEKNKDAIGVAPVGLRPPSIPGQDTQSHLLMLRTYTTSTLSFTK